MRKVLVLIITLVFIFLLSSCSLNINPKEEVKDEDKVIALINEYKVEGTNGFDYSLEQKLNGVTINSHSIIIRLDNTNETIGSRIESKKDLNEEISQGQYTELSGEAYYKNGQIATLENGELTWKSCNLSDFVSINISSFDIDITKLEELKLSEIGQNKVLTFMVKDSDASSFLGVSGSIEDLSFEIKTDANCERLISFVMSYSQNLTTTKFTFTPYYGSVSIKLPE